jgi:hypothetical protein
LRDRCVRSINPGGVSPSGPYQPVTDATVSMRTFAPRRHDRHGPVSPKADAVTWPDRPTKPQIPAPRAQRQSVCRVGRASHRDDVESTACEKGDPGPGHDKEGSHGGVETNHFDRRWRRGGVWSSPQPASRSTPAARTAGQITSATATATASVTTPAAGTEAHNKPDVWFVRHMIPHHQQAIEVSDIVLAKHGIDPRVTEYVEIEGRGHSLILDHGWPDVANPALTFIKRFL